MIKEPQFEVTQSIDPKKIIDLLICAFEGGVGYWCQITDYQKPKKIGHCFDENHLVEYADYPVNVGGAVILRDIQAAIETTYTLDAKAIQKGLEKMAKDYPRHFHDFMDENEDAETGDVFVQCCIFEDVIYG